MSSTEVSVLIQSLKDHDENLKKIITHISNFNNEIDAIKSHKWYNKYRELSSRVNNQNRYLEERNSTIGTLRDVLGKFVRGYTVYLNSEEYKKNEGMPQLKQFLQTIDDARLVSNKEMKWIWDRWSDFRGVEFSSLLISEKDIDKEYSEIKKEKSNGEEQS